MRAPDVIAEALRSLGANRLRAGLTTLGVIIGVASVVLLMAIGAGTQASIHDEIERTGTNLVLVMPGAPASARPAAGPVRGLLTDEDARILADEGYGIVAVAPTVASVVRLASPAGGVSSTLQGVTDDFFAVRNWRLASGRSIVEEDLLTSSRVAMIGATVAENLFPGQDPVGAVLRVNEVQMEVIGVLEAKGRSMDGSDEDDVVLLPLTTAREQIIGRQGVTARSVGMVTVKIADSRRIEEGIAEIRDILRLRHALPPGQPDDFRLTNLAEMLSLQQEASAAMTRLLAAIASISLVVGGIGIMNIMLVSVTERTREIGIRMALGAEPRAILAQFLAEAVTLSVAGGAAGAGCGLLAAWLADSRFGLRALPSTEPLVLALLFATLVGLLFGIYPAMMAARKSPLEALRQD
ncbi:ABC transporter permease [Salipiger sp. H15]|uniref:ABC transporter permease n=1 Tax=Alloyangia sp. H15 TaxID=3029062 RepID=A0AAU8AMT3_9RHOB